jgi:hypothetical protein
MFDAAPLEVQLVLVALVCDLAFKHRFGNINAVDLPEMKMKRGSNGIPRRRSLHCHPTSYTVVQGRKGSF